jgi:hypothetical protein
MVENSPSEALNEARGRMLTVMIVLADLSKRKDMKEIVTQIDDGRNARTLVIMTVVCHPIRYLDTERLITYTQLNFA